MIKSGLKKQKEGGFTIVELLIVVVVIAILAAITIVAYNGIQNRAKDSAAKTASNQTSKKIALYFAANSDTYPSSLTEPALGLANASATPSPYQYTVSPDGKTFCLTTTTSNISYFNTESAQNPKRGSCFGHERDGTQTVINRFMNPQFEGPSAPMNQTGTTGATIADFNGSKMAQATTTTTAAVSMRLQPHAQRWAMSEGQSVYASVLICNGSAGARMFGMTVRFYDSASTTSLGSELSTAGSAGQTLAAGACSTFTANGVAPAGTLSAGVNVNRNTGSGAISGDIYYADNVIFADRTANFADGYSNGWMWQGTPDNSMSYGVPL